MILECSFPLTYQQASGFHKDVNAGILCALLKDFFVLGQKSSAQYLCYPSVLHCVPWLKGKKRIFIKQAPILKSLFFLSKDCAFSHALSHLSRQLLQEIFSLSKTCLKKL